MNTNAVIRLMSLLSLWMWTGQGQDSFKPQLAPDLQGRITSNTVILKEPVCVFDGPKPCSGCEIWLVAALTSATGTFDAQLKNSSSNILSVSPYPTAFGQSSENFFVTRVGRLEIFPCDGTPNNLYFRVGTEGKCTAPNCNGILPDGSIVSFKYLLIDVNNQSTVVNSSNWSDSIPLMTNRDPQSINGGLSARSGAMVVITTILCVAAALLLLLFFIMLCVAYCGRKDISQSQGQGTTPMRVMNSIRIPRYDIHSLRGRPHPYDNQGFVSEGKKYSTSETLPKSGIQTQKL